MKRFALILLLAIAASCTKTPVQIVPDEFVGIFRGYHFFKSKNGDKTVLVQNDAIKFEVRPDGTYTGTTFYVHPSLGLVTPEDGLFKITSEREGTVTIVKDSINFSSHYPKESFKVQIQSGMYHEFDSESYFMLLKKDGYAY